MQPDHQTALLYSVWLNMLESSRGCLYVCVSVCVSVCVCVCVSVSALQPSGLNRFGWKSTEILSRMFASAFFSNFENFNLMTSWRPFCRNLFRHSHGDKLALIFIKLTHDVAYILGLFAIENQQDRKTSSIQNCVPRIGPAAILEPKIKISQNVKTKGRVCLFVCVRTYTRLRSYVVGQYHTSFSSSHFKCFVYKDEQER